MNGSVSDIQAYRTSIEQLRFGKRVGSFLYLHVDGLDAAPKTIQSVINFAAELAKKQSFTFNIVKVGTKQLTLSLLNYPGFWRQPFPVLEQSAKLNLQAHALQVTDYRERSNRPVLHRKELLLPPGHTHYDKFAKLTAQAEAFGLFKDASSIGLTKGWSRALAKSGLKIVGHTLKPKTSKAPESDDASTSIERHKTAMRRQHLSQPLQAIQKYGYLDGSCSIFDYGCGRGDDIALLTKSSVNAQGWDPYYHPNRKKCAADVVNLGFVINVIENRPERDLAIKESFELAKKFVVISALVGSPAYFGRTTTHGDGVVTSLGTFQKYFMPDELENYVREIVRAPVVSICQGIVLAFKNNDEADRFRARRVGASQLPKRGSMQRAEELYLLNANARDVLVAFWKKSVSLGREPLASELTEMEAVETLGLSPSTAFKYLSNRLGIADVEGTASLRRNELLVQFALGHFDGRVYYKYLSENVQKDIELLFGGYSNLMNQSRKLLFSISDTDLLMKACSDSASEGIGYFLTDSSLQLHISTVERLPCILQVYVGCAVRKVGDFGRANLVKIHIMSGKVSLLAYDDFDDQPVPYLIERIKIDLWKGRIDYFDYIGEFAPPPLLMKSLFLPSDYECFDEQADFDGQMLRIGLVDPSNPHPSKEEFQARLAASRLTIDGFQVRRT